MCSRNATVTVETVQENGAVCCERPVEAANEELCNDLS